jgi:hypothetical protein
MSISDCVVSGGRLVSIVRSRTQATELSLVSVAPQNFEYDQQDRTTDLKCLLKVSLESNGFEN